MASDHVKHRALLS